MLFFFSFHSKEVKELININSSNLRYKVSKSLEL
nr:MAG TPA: hypothetical protein [Caudoviricetes sp.]